MRSWRTFAMAPLCTALLAALLGAATEEIGVASLEPNDQFAFAGRPDELSVDLGLPLAHAPRPLADEDQLTAGLHDLELVGVDQSIVEHHVRLAKAS